MKPFIVLMCSPGWEWSLGPVVSVQGQELVLTQELHSSVVQDKDQDSQAGGFSPVQMHLKQTTAWFEIIQTFISFIFNQWS